LLLLYCKIHFKNLSYICCHFRSASSYDSYSRSKRFADENQLFSLKYLQDSENLLGKDDNWLKMASAHEEPRGGADQVLEYSDNSVDPAHLNEIEAAKLQNYCDLFVDCLEDIRGLNKEDISGGQNSKCARYYQLCQNTL
jgi:hypothetical protein